jgi:hypothetical protein
MTTATNLAALLNALAEHLNTHPNLPVVNIARRGDQKHALQISAFTSLGEPREAAALADWFDSLTDPVLTATPWKRSKDYPRAAKVELTGKTTNGTEVLVWDLVQEIGKPLGFTKDTNQFTEVKFDVAVLRELAKADQA